MIGASLFSSAAFGRALADLVLVAHFSYVAFVVGGFVIIWMGFIFRWSFVRNFWFRLSHLLAMGIVFVEAIGGVTCPLTAWEDNLRRMAGEGGTYSESFVQHWLHRLLFFELGEGDFKVIYALVFVFILLTFRIVRPRWPRRAAKTAA